MARPQLDPTFDSHLGTMPPIGLSTLWHRAFSGGGVAALREDLIRRLEQGPDSYAMLDMTHILQLEFQRAAAMKLQAITLKSQQLYRLAQARAPRALRLLLLKATGDLMSNTPVELLLDDYDLTVDVLYVTAGVPLPTTLPDHDVLMVAVAESAANRALLAELARVLADWPRPVLNQPAQIASLSRDTCFRTLSGIPQVVMPATVRVARGALLQLARGQIAAHTLLAHGQLPLIVRPIDSHAGQGLIKLEHTAQLPPYLAEHDAAYFFISRFIDYASPDGLFRKFRVALIGGRPHLCHLGISSHWMVHYPYEEMLAEEARRAEEARLMQTFAHDFARRHGPALAAIQQRVGLDYVGMDCAELPDGRLLIFEMSSAMLVHRMDPETLFPYKPPHMSAVFATFYRLLESVAGRVART